MQGKEGLKRAYDLAKRDLRACYTEEGILAGKIRFDDYWARDSFFASLGSLSLKDFVVVRRNLELFARHQNSRGQLPRRIDRYWVTLKYLGLRIKRRRLGPRYATSLLYCKSIDQNSLFIMSLADYVKKTNDLRFLKQMYEKTKKAIEWSQSNDHDRNLLIEEGYLANWEDTVFWRGEVLYTNVLHYKALADFAELSKSIGKMQEYNIYKATAEKVKDKINRDFWNGDHYMKSVTRKKRYRRYFCIDANMLAILFGIADKGKAEKILQNIVDLELNTTAPMRSTWPRYPLWKISPARIITFSAGYHNAFGWLWISCLYALALDKAGKHKEAIEYLERIGDKIREFEGVYEVYKKGRPVGNPFVKSDFPFAWSAGMFVYAYNYVG